MHTPDDDPERTLLPGIVGASACMRALCGRARKVARTDVNVCILGESGTGKELVARAIHGASARRDRPFVVLDAPAIPGGLFESHLFGHVRGAFTGAHATRSGAFTEAHTGTIFIDEIGDLDVRLQAKLLRVLQERAFTKAGSARREHVDVRVVTATNRDLWADAQAGRFREDLYHRIAVVRIVVPPLRERRQDIPVLVEHFLELLTGRHGRPMRRLTPAALDALMAHAWPGNVRELQNCLEQAVVLASGDRITAEHLLPSPVTGGRRRRHPYRQA